MTSILPTPLYMYSIIFMYACSERYGDTMQMHGVVAQEGGGGLL